MKQASCRSELLPVPASLETPVTPSPTEVPVRNSSELATKPTVKFAPDHGFLKTVRDRVSHYLQRTGKSERDCLRMYLKSAFILMMYAAAYIALVFLVDSIWLAIPLGMFLALTMAMIGFSIQHDGNHRAYSNHGWMNRIAASTIDLLGASSFLWRYQHVVIHHTSPNIDGHDIDIDLGMVARVAPTQRRRTIHRWQHLYLWVLYGLTSARWHLYTDFRDMLKGSMNGHKLPPRKFSDVAVFIGGKIASFTLLLGLPMMFHAWWVVLLFYGLVCGTLGVVLSITFQLAHCVQEANFPVPEESSNRIAHSWAVHQVETTVDFARQSRLAAWFFGGLNFQIEHHLFPRLCHIHYRAIAPIVEETCREFGIRYADHGSLWAGLVSHYRWLRRMGRPDEASSETQPVAQGC